MSHTPTDHFIQVNNITIHYVDHGGNGPLLILLHGLTANAHAFDGLIAHGLGKGYRIICPDFRGNGLSDKPAFNYSVEEHALDILGLIAHLGGQQVFLGGHSFGGYLAFHITACHPQFVSRLVILDAARAMNPNAPAMLSTALSRLNVTYPTFAEYIEHVKLAPYLNFWDPAMLPYYRADVYDAPEGGVKPHCNLMTITEKSISLASLDWPETIQQIQQPAILLNALDIYTLGEPLLPEEIARETVEMMKDAKYAGVDGNHQTMLYGDGAKQIVDKVHAFLS